VTVAAIAILIVAFALLLPETTLASYSCTSSDVVGCAAAGLAGIRGLFTTYFPRTILALSQLLLVALAVFFVVALVYGLKKSRED
jgi:hypothetical protein